MVVIAQQSILTLKGFVAYVQQTHNLHGSSTGKKGIKNCEQAQKQTKKRTDGKSKPKMEICSCE